MQVLVLPPSEASASLRMMAAVYRARNAWRFALAKAGEHGAARW